MPGRLMVLVVGVALAFSMLGSAPASAASKKKRPDLVVTAVVASPTKVAVGGDLKVRDTTTNRGRAAARKSVTRHVLSKNMKLDRSDVRLRDRSVKRLKPRRSHASSVQKLRIPARTKPGTYWLLACADASGKVRESNERNNCRAATKRITITAAAPAWPTTGAVKVNVSAVVDVSYRNRSVSTGFRTDDDNDVTINGRGSGWLIFENGKPESVTWLWSAATASGTKMWDAEGQTNTDCRWDAYSKFSRTVPLDLYRDVAQAMGRFDFPGSKWGASVDFGFEQDLGSVETPQVNCHGTTIGNVSPVPTLWLRQYFWGNDPSYSMTWSRDLSTVRWREYGESNYTSPGGTSTQNQSYESVGTLRLTPIR